MKKIFLFIACLTIVFLNYAISQAQTNNWIRVSSDDGEFSIEIPAKYKFGYDKDGFWDTKDRSNYHFQNMYLLNAFEDGALLSFERYDSKKGGVDALYESDKGFGKNSEVNISEIKSNGITIKQITTKTDKFYCVRQYFSSKAHVYILTIASKDSANPTMKRFLDSLVFKPDTTEKPATNSILFSSLKGTSISITEVPSSEKDKQKPSPKSAASDNIEPLIIIQRPRPAYRDVARMDNVKGVIQVRATFSEDGFIPKMEVIKSLPDGLVRQVIFALLRVKFLPQMKDGKFESVTRVVEYSFSIY